MATTEQVFEIALGILVSEMFKASKSIREAIQEGNANGLVLAVQSTSTAMMDRFTELAKAVDKEQDGEQSAKGPEDLGTNYDDCLAWAKDNVDKIKAELDAGGDLAETVAGALYVWEMDNKRA